MGLEIETFEETQLYDPLGGDFLQFWSQTHTLYTPHTSQIA